MYSLRPNFCVRPTLSRTIVALSRGGSSSRLTAAFGVWLFWPKFGQSTDQVGTTCYSRFCFSPRRAAESRMLRGVTAPSRAMGMHCLFCERSRFPFLPRVRPGEDVDAIFIARSRARNNTESHYHAEIDPSMRQEFRDDRIAREFSFVTASSEHHLILFPILSSLFSCISRALDIEKFHAC